MPGDGAVVAMLQGRVKALSPRGDYGFIRSSDTDFFFHRSDLAKATFDDLFEGCPVRFEVVEPTSARGPRAKNVAPVTEPD
jgi:cold shock CspA family protein